jgi:hypothetical protein
MVLPRLTRPVLVLALISLAAGAAGAGGGERSGQVEWRLSRSLGLPWSGRLVNGVRLPPSGKTFFTWDPVLKRKPNRPWRRWGNDRLVRTLLRVLAGYRAAHPDAPRVAIGDLSRARGGDFSSRFGGLGHASHQNGLDVDVYYPRKDRREAAPRTVGQVDVRLAQDLVDRFVAAGARYVFVGPNLPLRGPRAIVEPLVHHDNHLHVRIPNPGWVSRAALGRSAHGRPLRAVRLGDRSERRRVLVVGCIHGDECAGTTVTRALVTSRPLVPADLWVVPTLNPDGRAQGTRQNARGVDLNRNFPSRWRPIGRRGHPQYSGRRPLSEPETRAAAALIRRIRPRLSIWFHQPQGIVRAWGRSVRAARRYARLSQLPFRALRWPPGTAPNWQNRRFRGGASFVVELPPGRLSRAEAVRHARAILALAARR